jgi:hypothetical protein
MAMYYVKFKVGNTTSSRDLSLEGGTESEAVAKLKAQSSVAKDAGCNYPFYSTEMNGKFREMPSDTAEAKSEGASSFQSQDSIKNV